MKKRKTRARGRVWPFILSAVFALCVMCAVIFGISRLNDTKIAEYPMIYTGPIISAARENSIPPAYIAAVIMAESSYDPSATSPVGAMGLMQIMPQTGEWIAGKLGEDYAGADMYDAETCIRYGAWYLGFLMDRYSGDMRCATAAYHAGQGTVDSWLADAAYSDDGVTLKTIGYDSTSKYVSRVSDLYKYYSLKYSEDT